ncbi:type II toxin-antitoxin system prevent-host-death family antitoxin [Limnoraphis robusta CCNP1324]|uniref:type II toxin-antitoxin system Phd/YefM family antitoxin n=1 Tax=Limnoraphis robusta TaxID=1118279 RepID=UPI002B1EDCD5|nr:type II toxin-antitoxin system prevent-host-death family antitoxin [Limnoraphis robusta]MEA5547655.1 type II toxin-antitoxin system prevent-host-death family antitoxin [Limnoraphis robusta CCNP1324]
MAKRIAKSTFQAQVLGYLREVEVTGEALVITDRGRPVVRIVPIAPAAETLARLRGCVLRYDDPTEPVAVEGWEALG